MPCSSKPVQCSSKHMQCLHLRYACLAAFRLLPCPRPCTWPSSYLHMPIPHQCSFIMHPTTQPCAPCTQPTPPSAQVCCAGMDDGSQCEGVRTLPQHHCTLCAVLSPNLCAADLSALRRLPNGAASLFVHCISFVVLTTECGFLAGYFELLAWWWHGGGMVVAWWWHGGGWRRARLPRGMGAALDCPRLS